ncbi:MAG TPA: hypothetical protein VNP97_12415 [Microbacterium sp.]|nr:hypothetical protein [Microbacterium sp.]
MGILTRFRRRKNPYTAVSEEEQISRYVYLLNTLPASVIESAHASAFRDVPAARRREMFEQLRPFMSDAERDAAPDDPNVLAKLVRRAEERRAQHAAASGGADAAAEASVTTRTATADPDASVDPRDVMMRSGVMALVAYQFIVANSVTAYFTVGAGSLMIGDQPGWVGDMVDPGSAGIDAGGFGGGFDGGGSFDAGGFGGGFDGGGGFG